MFEHLTQTQIEDYGRQKLSAAELLSVSDHLGTCASCRGQVGRALGSELAFFALHSELFDPGSEVPFSTLRTHLSVEQIAEFVDGVPTGEELQLVEDHLTSCGDCVLAVNDLHDFKNQVASTLPREYHPEARSTSESWRDRLLSLTPSLLLRSPVAFSSALAVLLIMVTGWLVWHAQQKIETNPAVAIATHPPTITPTPTPLPIPMASPIPGPEGAGAAVIVELNDGGGRLTVDREGKLSGVDHLPPAYQRMVKESLSNQRLAKSSLLAGLNHPGSSLMGGEEQGKTFSLIGPTGKVMLSDRPTFRWSKLEGASGYLVEIYDEEYNLAATSSEITDYSWTAPQPLRRGRVYSWQVKAIKDGQEFRSPRPPAPQAKFHIVDQAKANELLQARGAYSSSHLTLGLLYAQAGLLDEAEQEFQALKRSNPESAVVRRLLSQVQKLRR